MSNTPIPVEFWDVEVLKPYEANAKKHERAQVQKLATAITTYGWTQPIVVDKNGVIIIGHGRHLAAISLGLKKVPVICRRDLDELQVKALRLADNRVTSTDYDQELIRIEISELIDANYDVGTMGFDENELNFAGADLGSITDDFFVDDVSGAVERQKEQNSKASENMDDTAAPVADALGFKRVSIAQSREIRDLMNKVEARTNKTGVEALLFVLSAAASVNIDWN